MSSSTNAIQLLRSLMRRTLEYDFSVWFWGDAIAIDGLLEAAELLNDETPLKHALRFYKAWAKRSLGWHDHLTPGKGLLRLYQVMGDAELLDAAIRLASWLEQAPRSPRYDTPLYRPDLPPYRHTVWVDTIYHEPPFFCLLAQVTGEYRYYDIGIDIWRCHVRALSSQQGPLLAHAVDTGMRALRGYGWGRGNGWALYGMVDTLELLPKDHPEYVWALHNMQSLAHEIAKLQDDSGFWRTLLHDREAYLESSTASFFGGAFLRAMRLGLLGAEFAVTAERAWRATVSRIDSEGSFFGVSACTYAGVTLDDVISMYKTLPTEVNVWGQGSALRITAERIRSGLY